MKHLAKLVLFLPCNGNVCCLCRKCNMVMYGGKRLPSCNFEPVVQPSEALGLLLNLTPHSSKVCSSRPIGVTTGATFVVANRGFGRIDDLKAGVRSHKGKPIRKYEVSRQSSREVYGAELVDETGGDVYQLVRIYYHHKHTLTFRRTLFYAIGMFK